jgi:hypothetical protein
MVLKWLRKLWQFATDDKKVWDQSIRLSVICGILMQFSTFGSELKIPFNWVAVIGYATLIVLLAMPAVIAGRARRYYFLYGSIPLLMLIPWFALLLVFTLWQAADTGRSAEIIDGLSSTSVYIVIALSIVWFVMAGFISLVRFEIGRFKLMAQIRAAKVEESARAAVDGAWPPAPTPADPERPAE